MNRNVLILTFTLLLFTPLATPAVFSNSIFAQLSDTDQSSNPENMASAPLLEKIRGASSLSNIQIISWVDGIEVSGVNVGDGAASITLKQVGGDGDNDSNKSIPVTVTVIKTPGSSIKNLLALVEASNKLAGKNTTNPLVGMIGKLGELPSGSPESNTSLLAAPAGSNVTESIKPLQALLQIGQNTQIGIGNIVGGDWEKPRTVTTGLSTLGELLGMGGSRTTDERAHIIMVLVAPYSGKTSFGSVELH